MGLGQDRDPGDASETDSEYSASLSEEEELYLGPSGLTRGRPTGLRVTGEAAETNSETEPEPKAAPRDLPPVVVQRDTAGETWGTEEMPLASSTRSLLQLRLADSQARLDHDVAAAVSGVYRRAGRDVATLTACLASTQAVGVAAVHSVRLVRGDLRILDDRLDIVADCHLLPDIRGMPRMENTQEPEPRPHTQSLETLNLGHNPIGNEGVRNLKNGLISNRSVLRLGLASSKLTCEGAVAVAEFIAESPRLLRLDLRENEIKTGGLMALSLALKVNHSLLRLDLDREPKKEAVKSFLETQKALLAEIQSGCRRNFVLAREREEQAQLAGALADITVAPVSPAAAATPDGPPEPPAVTGTHENGAPAGPSPDSDSDSDSEREAGEPEEGPCPALVPPTDTLDPGDRSLPGSPAEQRISVSSPGRGHKVFVVTRVESPPESADPPVPPAPLAPSPEAGDSQDLGAPEPPPPLPGPPLPNGLKPEFALALAPEPPPTPEVKGGSCGLEHELSCSRNEQELEKLLLEASQDSGQETL